MNYAIFTLEGFKEFLEHTAEHYAGMNKGYNDGKYKGTWEKWDCITKYDDAVDGAISFIIWGTSASDDWELFQDLKYKYREKLEKMLADNQADVA